MASERAILHIDMNNCYASIEMLHHPKLRGRPVAVAGDAEARHGIILAKSYEAKSRGVTVGQAIWQAKQKCPDLIVVPPHYDLYLRFSNMLRSIVANYTDQVEPFGLDEMWADVTHTLPVFKCDERELAETIRSRVKDEMGVTVSIGVSYNKIFAKLGSDYKKPDAVTVISRNNYKDIVWPLPAEDLLGVGQATRKKLYGHYVRTIGDIAEKDPQLLQSWLGKWGLILHCFANGQDHSPVERLGNESIIKSVGNSTTTPRDLENEQDCKIVLQNLSDSVAVRLRDLGLMCRTVQISVRDNTLASFERQLTLPQPTCLASELRDTAMRLLRENYNWKKPIRSIGVRGMNLIPYQTPNQLSLFEDDAKRERQEKLERALDDIRRRFGYHAIGLAMLSLDQVLGRLDAKSDNTIHPVGYF